MRSLAPGRGLPRLTLLLTIAIGVALASAFAQQRLEFEVVSIRPLAPNVFPRLGYDLRGIAKGRLRIRALPARELIEWAYPEFKDDEQRVLGGPAWMRSALFEVEAIFDPEFLTRELPTNPGGSTPGVPPAVALMMRSVLEDRFKLKVRGTFALWCAPEDERIPIVEGRGVPIETFVDMLDLAAEFEGPLRNMTGLEGLFDFELPLRAQLGGATLPLTSRYGLKIDRRRTRDRVLMVDEIREPSPN